jgi:putative alpha-1,2-mannosidase
MLVMPTGGALNVDYKSYGSTYTNEVARPGYYSSVLTKYGIKTEVTATLRSSRERYTFKKGEGHILLNLGEGLTNECGAMVRRVSETEVEGFKLMGTFCYTTQAVFPIYFVMRVSKVPSKSGCWKFQPTLQGVEGAWCPDDGTYKLYENYYREMAGNDIGYHFSYDDLAEGEQIEVSMGVSMVSMEKTISLPASIHGRKMSSMWKFSKSKKRPAWQGMKSTGLPA